jgi:predicted nuclease of restriction endonuclease-like (RecB) superfamily
MRNFYVFFSKSQTMSGQLTWSHYIELLKLVDKEKINYYIKIIEEENLSVRELRQRIKNNDYERLDEETKKKLKDKEKLKLPDLVKNPIQIKNTSGNNEISEKVLQKLILEDIPSFLKELGSGFSFIDNEYKIKMGDRYNYIDLLLYNIKYKCYVVVELKVTELNSNHTGQIQKYMNYIDKNIKNIDDNKTVGIIICKKENKYVIEYCSDNRIIAREYELV